VHVLVIKKDSSPGRLSATLEEHYDAEMILGFASRYAYLGDLDKWAASRLQVACK